MMHVYVAGPMRGVAQFNFPRFDECTDEIYRTVYHGAPTVGIDVFSPAARDRNEHPEIDWSELDGHEDLSNIGFNMRAALAADTEWICKTATHLVVLAGWEQSSGARAEVALAQALGLPIFTDGSFISFLRGDDAVEPLNPQLRVVDDMPPPFASDGRRHGPDTGWSGPPPTPKDTPGVTSTLTWSTDAETARLAHLEREAKYRAANPAIGERVEMPTETEVTHRLADAVAAGQLGGVRTGPAYYAGTVDGVPHYTHDGQLHDEAIYTPDPDTGGVKGVKVERFDLIPPEPLRLLARHYGINCVEHGGKYPARNWELGYPWSQSYGALMRHANAWARGEDIDAETNSPHMIAVAWHAFALVEWAATHLEKDDRHA